MKNLVSAIFVSTVVLSGFAQADTSILPPGVRAMVYQHIDAGVPGRFNSDGVSNDFAIKETLGTSVIKSISKETNDAYAKLYQISPQTAQAINLGNINLSPEIKVTANAFGLAWGLSNRVMVAVGFPVMKASVTVKGGYFDTGAVMAASNSLAEIAKNNPSISTEASALAQTLAQLPTIKGENLQDVIVNQFHYQPIGSWSATGIGDTQTYIQAKVYDGDIYKNGEKVGAILPTGRTDDPDNLVDIPFGTGYTSPFLETINDFIIVREYLMLTLVGRYQYALPTNRTFRLWPSTQMPLTADKEDIRYKAGDTVVGSAELSSKLFRSIVLSTAYTVKSKGRDSIHGARADYDYSILETTSASKTDTVEASVGFSTVDLYLRKKFPIPCKVGATYSKVVGGKNTERVSASTLGFEMYF